MTKNLPQPSQQELAHSEQLMALIREACPITFAQYMEMALYSPGLGYYSAGLRKFGKEGDFVTAPEISSLFSCCLAEQIAEIFAVIGGDALEFGAGSGVMAADCLLELERLKQLPEHYYILELSADLRDRQKKLLQKRIPHLLPRVIWLDMLPEKFTGVMLANEVLDAMPVHSFHQDNSLKELYVDWDGEKFYWQLHSPSTDRLIKAIAMLDVSFAPGYTSEINLNIRPWLAGLAKCLRQGVILLIDYGFPRHEYYHLDRNQGTLMCHYHHRAHVDPLILTGLQDITAHVDFTEVSNAALNVGLDVAGYTTQMHFLINCGLLKRAEQMMGDAVQDYKISGEVKKLTLPSEMGELFKAIALTKNYKPALSGFSQYNFRDKL